jgi:hypothetical protein
MVGSVNRLLSPGRALTAFIAATGFHGVAPAGEQLPQVATDFFDHYCSECHYEDKSGGLDLSELAFDPDNRDNFSTWVRLVDRVTAGEMPPKKKERPAPADLAAFTHSVSSSLTAFEQQSTARDGRAIQRRLNRYEYENALRDLLNVPWAQV